MASSPELICNRTCSRSFAFRRSTISNSTWSSVIFIDSSSTITESFSFSEQENRFLLRLVPVQCLATFAATTSPSYSPAARLRIRYEGTNLPPFRFINTRPFAAPPLTLEGKLFSLKACSILVGPTFSSMPLTASSNAGLRPVGFLIVDKLGILSGNLFFTRILLASFVRKSALNSSFGCAASATIVQIMNSTVARVVSKDSFPLISNSLEKSG